MKRVVSFVVLFFFASFVVPKIGFAGQEISYNAELGNCRKAVTKREEGRAKHLFFPISEGKKLWDELATLRLEKKKIKLIDSTLTIKDETISLWKMQFEAAEKALVAKKKVEVDLRLSLGEKDKRIGVLTKENQDLTLLAAKYKGEKYAYLMWGALGGVLLVLLIIGGVAIYFTVNK